MTEVIYKYKLDFNSEQAELPGGAKILNVAAQGGDIFLWAMVNPEHTKEVRVFSIYGTGWDINHPDNHNYIGTVFMQEYVWHIFEISPN